MLKSSITCLFGRLSLQHATKMCFSSDSINVTKLTTKLPNAIKPISYITSTQFKPHTISWNYCDDPLKPNPAKSIINPFIPLPPMNDPLIKQDLILPEVRQVDMDETGLNVVIEKHAVRMIVIRRRKMRVHKRKKLIKRMKFVWRKRRRNKDIKQEKEFQAEMVAQVKQAEAFRAAEYVSERLRLSREKIGVTRVRGFIPPAHILNEILKEREEEMKMKKRVADCIRRSKQKQ